MRVTRGSEEARQWVHMGSGLFALLLRALTWWQAAALAAFAFVFNAVILPRVGGRHLYRPLDQARGFPLGILLYPLSVLALILVFPTRLDMAAAAWAILSFGDGAATLVGMRSGRRQTPWNPEKTVEGTIAFFVCGALAGTALAWWTRPAITPLPSLAFVILAPTAAAFAAALVETMPVRLDDNVSVPATAGAVLWLASLVTRSAAGGGRALVLTALPWAVIVNAVASWLGYRAGTVTRSGMITGAVIGAIVYAGAGLAAWTLLFLTFFTAAIVSRLGLSRKVLLGIAEDRAGRRSGGNAFANCGVAAIAALAAVTTPNRSAALLALVAALVAAGSDTVASEIGKAWGRATFLITRLARVQPGTPGAMSAEGTAAGVVAALALAACAVELRLISGGAILVVVIAATAGALVESALGATLEGPGIVNNDMLNFINTTVAAAVALLVGT